MGQKVCSPLPLNSTTAMNFVLRFKIHHRCTGVTGRNHKEIRSYLHHFVLLHEAMELEKSSNRSSIISLLLASHDGLRGSKL